MVRLGDVCEFVYGFPFDSNAFNDEGTGKPLIRIRDVVPGVTNTFTTEQAPSKYDVSDGDLLVGMDGDFNLAQWAGGPALLNQRVCMFKPKPGALSVGFLKHSLGKFLKAIWDKKPFATVKHLSAKDLNAIILPLPPLSIQREIVARLERELAAADSLASNFKRIAELADAGFKAELDELFKGLLGKTVKLGNLCSKIGSGATPSGGKKAYCKDGISLIRSQNVLDFSFSHHGLAHINEKQARQLDGVTVKDEDVLVNITGDSVARVCKVDSAALPARVNQHVAIVRVRSEQVSPDYIVAFLQYDKDHLLRVARGKSTRNALTKAQLEEWDICLPDKARQQDILAKIGLSREKSKRLQDVAERGLRAAENLRAAILSEAFT